MDLKLQLKELRDKELNDLHHLDSLIENMLLNIGSVDSELRDELIYQTFIRFMQEDRLSGKQYQHILETCLNNLFFNIGDESTDSVFTRSFCSLVIAAILLKDRQAFFYLKPNFRIFTTKA